MDRHSSVLPQIVRRLSESDFCGLLGGLERNGSERAHRRIENMNEPQLAIAQSGGDERRGGCGQSRALGEVRSKNDGHCRMHMQITSHP
jgi:hypothetical protein